MREKTIAVTLESMPGSSLVMHKWSVVGTREARSPQQEVHDATYFTEDGELGLNVRAIKGSFIGAAHRDLGIDKKLVRKALFIRCTDKNHCLPMRHSGMVTRVDRVLIRSIR